MYMYVIFSLANYSVIVWYLGFKRDMSDKFVRYYVPCTLVVVVSISTFWIGLHAVSEKITIGITGVLTILTQFYDVRTVLPLSKNISALGIYILTCLMFVTFQLMESCIVDYIYEIGVERAKWEKQVKHVLSKWRKLVMKRRGKTAYNNYRKNPFAVSSN